jgi:hypothetical protein
MAATRAVVMDVRRARLKRDQPGRIRLDAILKGHENQWVALSDSMEVIGAGRTVEAARQAARDKGHDLPLIVWAPPSFRGFCL